jgi:hypothetical protein
MAIKTNSTEIVALKSAVEKRFGRSVETRTDFSLLAADIEFVTRDHLADNTLRRLWGRISGYDTVFVRTLDVLSRYVGYKQFSDFCQGLNDSDGVESVLISDGLTIKAEQLIPGERIRIGWLPNRVCIVEYVGGRMFKAIECKSSTLQEGDTFECSVMIKGYPLFIDNLVHGGEHCVRYSIGVNNGLTILEKL